MAKTMGFADMDFSMTGSEEIAAHQLPMEKLHHFLLFYKEVLHNLAKHSHSSQVAITLTSAGRKIRLEIMDNGQPPPSGDLPQGLKLRAQKMGARLNYDVFAEHNHLALEMP